MRAKHWRFEITHACGTTGATLLIAGAIAMGGASGFINIPSMLITFGVAFFLMLATFRGEYIRFLAASFAILFFSPDKPNKRYAEMSFYAARFMIGAGATGMLVGLIQMLQSIDDVSSIGFGMGTSLITVLYAIVAAELWCVFAYRVFQGRENVTAAERTGKPPPVYTTGVALGVTFGGRSMKNLPP